MKTIIWKSEEYQSLEYCSITEARHTYVRSAIIGASGGQLYHVEYDLDIDAEWVVQNFHISYEVNDIKRTASGKKEKELWVINDRIAMEYANYKFIDISLTPFTNTLPIRNLNLDVGQQQEIEVIYIDILEGVLRPARQKYTRTGKQMYQFETVPKDFEAHITVDVSGFVERYPSLFDKLAST